jgi:hypothetical protein
VDDKGNQRQCRSPWLGHTSSQVSLPQNSSEGSCHHNLCGSLGKSEANDQADFEGTLNQLKQKNDF